MNLKIANSMSGYIEVLYNMNQNLIKVCGINIITNGSHTLEKIILDIIQDIPRLVPCSYSNSKKTLIYEDKNGLLEYKKDITYLEKDYEDILINNKNILDKIRKIRNKYEHNMHDVTYKSSSAGSSNLFDIEFEVNRNPVKVYSGELIKLIKELNLLFSKIVQEIVQFAYDNNKQEYLYFQKIVKFNFEDFNKIFDSDLLRTFGKIMNQY